MSRPDNFVRQEAAQHLLDMRKVLTNLEAIDNPIFYDFKKVVNANAFLLEQLISDKECPNEGC